MSGNPSTLGEDLDKTPPICAVCTKQAAIYTCPRCRLRSCSLSCSKEHKARDACSGERNKAAYVPLNQYGWGAMMDDYVYLEDVGRKVGTWGDEIVRGGFARRGAEDVRGRGVGARGRGTRGKGRGAGGSKTKRDVLRMQLDFRDIEMDVLPVGMERRKANQSNWDFKNRIAYLTIEFIFHPTPDPLAPLPTPIPPYTLLTHRNSTDKPLLELLQAHVRVRAKSKKDNSVPTWVTGLTCPHDGDPESFTQPLYLIRAAGHHAAPVRGPKAEPTWHKLDPCQPLLTSLRDKSFVEFPTIEVWEEGAFAGVIAGESNGVSDEERKPKRRKLSAIAGKKRIRGLLDGYGSDEDERPVNGMSLLGSYVGSDEEEPNAPSVPNGLEDRDKRMVAALEEDEEEGEVELSPEALLELMRAAHGAEWHPPSEDEEQQLDWGDDADSDT